MMVELNHLENTICMPHDLTATGAEFTVLDLRIPGPCPERKLFVRLRTTRLSVSEHLQQRGESCLEAATIDDKIQEAVLQDKLGALKAFREVLTDGFTNDAGTGKANE